MQPQQRSHQGFYGLRFIHLRISPASTGFCVTPARPTSEGEATLLLSVQVGRGGDEARVRVDAEELVAGARQQTVPDDSILL